MLMKKADQVWNSISLRPRNRILHLDTEIEDCELVQPFAGFEEEMLDYFDESSDDGGGDGTETEGCRL